MKTSPTTLFAVAGMSPAVLTETVWALAHEKPAVIPDRLVVLTTVAGRARIAAELFGPDRVWERLRASVCGSRKRQALRFGLTGDDIRVFTCLDAATGQSRELDDIRCAADHAAAADFILDNLRGFVENPETRVIASIAGGRKTMGALLYACMTLIGREDDRLTHVLVNAPYDDARLAPRFYFPGSAGREAPASWTPPPRVELADVPFVPLRNRFRDLAELPGTFRGLVVRCSKVLQEAAAPARIALDPTRRRVTVDDASAVLGPRAFDVLRYLLDVNARAAVPACQKDAADELRAFLGNPAWLCDENDLKRQLSEIRRALAAAGIAWQPGTRTQSLHLPPFRMVR